MGDADLSGIDDALRGADNDEIPVVAAVAVAMTPEGAIELPPVGPQPLVVHSGAGVKARASPAITWSWARTKKLLEILTCDDDVALHGVQAERWPTWGDLRRNPPSGGLNYLFYEVYKHWVSFDDSMKIKPEHEIFLASDVPATIGQLFATRLNQVVRPKWELASETVTGTPQTPKSAKAEAELHEHHIYELCESWFGQKGAGRRGKRKADAAADRSADSGASGRVTPGSLTHRGQLKPPPTFRSPPPAGNNSAGPSVNAEPSPNTGQSGSSEVGAPEVPLSKQLSATMPGLIKNINELGGVMAELKGAVSKTDEKLDSLLTFLMGGAAVPAAAPAAAPAAERSE